MDTKNRTYRDIIQFRNAATAWQHQNTQKSDSPMTGFRYAISRVLKSVNKVHEDYTDAVTDLNIDAASTDEQGHILNDARGGTISTKEASRKRNTAIRALLDKEVEVGVYLAKQWPDNLTDFQIGAFEGFVIPELKEPEEKS